ncbi:MAG: adhesin, partial [Bacteroidota bacterium]|nr:adhesin [Bacteroidota bacterium]
GGVVIGNTVTWDVPELQLGQIYTRYVYLGTPIGAPLGTELNHTASISTTLADAVPANNITTLVDSVVGSFDPNDKRVNPGTLTPQEIADGKPVDYTIRFQNTGTYLAETVRIEDQLSEDLSLSSFEFLGSSHPCTWSIDNGMLEFYFEQIMLPDSNANEPESHGFVMFKITPNSDLQLGDVVENSASIYFDFNEPVITEPAVFTIETSTG